MDLKYKDKVIFQGPKGLLKYEVRSRYLFGLGGIYNDQIFDDLGINKYVFCKKHYGYPPIDDRVWPEAKIDDYSALTRVVNALHDLCKENKEVPVSVDQVLKIHKIACSTWKDKIVKEYLTRIDSEQNITFSKQEVDEMFDAATTEQTPVLEDIFGKKEAAIDFEKLKTGSRVMIKRTGNYCCGFDEIDASRPVDIVFYKTPHYITDNKRFRLSGYCKEYVTLCQDDKYILFATEGDPDFITRVINY